MNRIHPEIRARARHNRHPQTPAEERLWGCLRDHRLQGIKFRRQHPIGPYIADFYCASARLVIEVDDASHAQKAAYDSARTEWLEQQGYRVIRFTNEEVHTRLQWVLEKIFEECGKPH